MPPHIITLYTHKSILSVLVFWAAARTGLSGHKQMPTSGVLGVRLFFFCAQEVRTFLKRHDHPPSGFFKINGFVGSRRVVFCDSIHLRMFFMIDFVAFAFHFQFNTGSNPALSLPDLKIFQPHFWTTARSWNKPQWSKFARKWRKVHLRTFSRVACIGIS